MNPNFPSRFRAVRLKPGRVKQTLGRHPWILDSSTVDPISAPRLGECVDVIGHDGNWIGRGLYHPTSRIRVRIYTFDPEDTLDAAWIEHRIARAVELRKQLLNWIPSDAIRWVFSEGDAISGLVVDDYAGHLVVQITAAVLVPYIDTIVAQLRVLVNPKSIWLDIDEKTAKAEGIEPQAKFLLGEATEVPLQINENGLLWRVDLQGGQKTGYYLDQRENRAAAARWAPLGAKVLDVCTYGGGFALNIAKQDSTASITAIDSSQKALEMAKANAEENGLADQLEFEQQDFFQALSDRVDSKSIYDMIVLDPPKLAGARDKVPRALAAYHRLNYLAMRCLRPGGILVTCSCSGRVSRPDFLDTLLGVAKRLGRDVQILEQRGAAADHPVNIHCPETDYLKCVICRIL